MDFKHCTIESNQETSKKIIEIESGYENFFPEDFKENPIGYFKSGQNIKSGEIIRDEKGMVREDPTAVKELPVWIDENGNKLQVIGKRVNVEKSRVGKSGNQFYEYEIMQIINKINLPCPKPIAKISQEDQYFIIMEKVGGFVWNEESELKLKDAGYSDEDIKSLKVQAQVLLDELKQKFEQAGIIRTWALKDMIFDIDLENKKVNKITPTDWERTKIDYDKLNQYKEKNDI